MKKRAKDNLFHLEPQIEDCLLFLLCERDYALFSAANKRNSSPDTPRVTFSQSRNLQCPTKKT